MSFKTQNPDFKVHPNLTWGLYATSERSQFRTSFGAYIIAELCKPPFKYNLFVNMANEERRIAAVVGALVADAAGLYSC